MPGSLPAASEDLQMEVKNGKKNEAKAQLEFEEAKGDAETLKKELLRKKDALEGFMAQENDDKTSEKTEKGSDEHDLGDENEHKAEIKPDCDWMICVAYNQFPEFQGKLQGVFFGANLALIFGNIHYRI